MMNVGLPFRLLSILVNGYIGHDFCGNTLSKMSVLIASNLILKIRLCHFFNSYNKFLRNYYGSLKTNFFHSKR